MQWCWPKCTTSSQAFCCCTRRPSNTNRSSCTTWRRTCTLVRHGCTHVPPCSTPVEIVDACKKYGHADRDLWVQALAYFAGQDEGCKTQIKELLDHIDRRNLLPPLMVVDALARNSTATLAIVKDYISGRLEEESKNIADDEESIRQVHPNITTPQHHSFSRGLPFVY